MMTAFLQLVAQVQRPMVELSRQIPAFIQVFTATERAGRAFILIAGRTGGSGPVTRQTGHLPEGRGLFLSGQQPQSLEGILTRLPAGKSYGCGR